MSSFAESHPGVASNFHIVPRVENDGLNHAGSDQTLATAPTDFYGQPRTAGSVSIGAIEEDVALPDVTVPGAPSKLVAQ